MTSIRAFQFLVVFTTLIGTPPSSAAAMDRLETVYEPPPILLYHRFGPTPADSMTVTDKVFLSHLDALKAAGYHVVPLRQIVEAALGGKPMPSKSVAIVVDDGHASVYTHMLPIVRKYHIPVTLFIYPSAISNASYAMTWSQLHELQKTGLFDIQSHTYWHPNFKKEKKKLTAAQYDQLVTMQFSKSRAKLEKEFGTKVDLIAWPFGIYDDELAAKAKEAGYIAAFTIEGDRERHWKDPMKVPRYLLTDAHRGKTFERILTGNSRLAAAGGCKK